MRTSRLWPRPFFLPASLLLMGLLAQPATGQEKRPLTFVDLMKLREIEQPSISDGGRWIAFTAEPDRGDPEVIVRSTEGRTRYVIPLGSNAAISHDGLFVAARLNPAMEASETAESEDAPRRGMGLLNTGTGEVREVDDVQAFAFSEDGRWLAYHKFEPR
ncbi:hypothetical protein ACFL3S_04775, partial [Gemmatimonadota bacterium]